MSTTLPFEPFATKNLLTLPRLDSSSADVWHGFKFEGSLENDHFDLAETEPVELDALRTDVLKLSLEDVSLPDLDSSLQSSTTASGNDELDQSHSPIYEAEAEDVWKLPFVQKPTRGNALVSWDRFLNQKHEECPTIYLSEAGAASYDALLRKVKSKELGGDGIKYAKPDLFISALFDLGLGRTSTFFVWNEDSSHFTEMYDEYTVSGFSQESVKQVCNQFLEVGAQFHQLEQYGKIKTKDKFTKVALKGAIVVVLNGVKRYMEDQRPTAVSLARLLELYNRAISLIKLTHELMEASERTPDQGQLLSTILSHVEQACSTAYDMECVFNQIMIRTLEPSIKRWYSEIGIMHAPASKDDMPDDTLNYVLPVSTIFIFNSAKASLQALRDNGVGDHTFLTAADVGRQSAAQYSWDHIVDLHEQADAYEQRLKQLILEPSTGGGAKHVPSMNTNMDLISRCNADDPFLVDFRIFEDTNTSIAGAHDSPEDSLQAVVLSALSGESTLTSGWTIPCRQALDLSITPFLKAQHRLLLYSVIQSIFQDYHVAEHLDILNRFQFLNDGSFTLRLSTALFDSDQNSGEGRRQTNANTGLRLHDRGTWPPASSELRLVLMDILSESLATNQNKKFTDTISFTIRHLSDEELERCRDINSIYALDFLRLHYKSPNPILDRIITPQTLESYDTIFNHLLRLLRLRTLTQTLLREPCIRPSSNSQNTTKNKHPHPPTNHRLLHSLHYFVTTLSSYAQFTISTLWLQFQTTLTKIQTSLNNNDYESTLSLTCSLDELRHSHEEVLVSITRSLLLDPSGKQRKAMRLLEESMGLVLKFAVVSSSEGKDGSGTVAGIYQDFVGKVRDFLVEVEKLSVNGGDGDEELEILEKLRLGLDFNGFYSRLGLR